jgi:peroxiredoxin
MVLWALVGLLFVIEVLLLLLLLQLLKQHGRLLLRVEQLERRPVPAVDASAQAPLPAGLPVGAPVEPFRLASLDGETVSLENFHGRRVLLVNWHPACGYCDQIAGELAALAPKLRARGTELVLASSGGADENRKLAADHGLRVPILLQGDQPISAFQGLGTPVAYLLDEAGRVARPLAFGAVDVPELARAVAAGRKRLPSERPLAESRIERDGLKAGTLAPGFTLPSLDGPEVSLEDFRGDRLLLVFSAPDCAPCVELSPELASFARDHAGRVPVLVVSRGGVEENRQKARAAGIDCPVVLQPGWRVSKDYGTFATPSAFLIDENGVIERDIARGRDEIMALAHQALAREEAPITS